MPPFANWYLCSCIHSPCPFPLKGSPVILLVSRSLPIAPNSSFLCHTCPAPRLLPYLCPRLLPSVTLAACPWLLSALPCLLPIAPILFCPFPVFGLPSSGSAILLCHLIFSFIGLYCSRVVSPFLLPPAAWMPAEGALTAQLREHRCAQPGACSRGYTDASHHQRRHESINTQ